MFKDDEKWVTEQILKINDYDLRKKAYDGYNAVYKKAFDAEKTEHRKIGIARKIANTKLREFVTKCLNYQN